MRKDPEKTAAGLDTEWLICESEGCRRQSCPSFLDWGQKQMFESWDAGGGVG